MRGTGLLDKKQGGARRAGATPFLAAMIGLGGLLLIPLKCEAKTKGEVVTDLPPPYNLQRVILHNAVNLTWKWDGFKQEKSYEKIVFEIVRGTSPLALVPQLTYTDSGIRSGTYVYRLRARALSRFHGKRITHLSDWSEPSEALIKITCEQPPTLTLAMETAKRVYQNTPILNVQLSGEVQVSSGCHILKSVYTLQSDDGTSRSGPLSLDSAGRFSQSVKVWGPEEETHRESMTFTVSVTAENEAGPNTSNAYTLDLTLPPRFAPRADE